MFMNDDLRRLWMEEVVCFNLLNKIHLKLRKKIMRNHSRISGSSDRELNPGYPEHESAVLTITSQRSVPAN
jgi:hypothetical protein